MWKAKIFGILLGLQGSEPLGAARQGVGPVDRRVDGISCLSGRQIWLRKCVVFFIGVQ